LTVKPGQDNKKIKLQAHILMNINIKILKRIVAYEIQQILNYASSDFFSLTINKEKFILKMSNNIAHQNKS
jgi:hypothetical protein